MIKQKWSEKLLLRYLPLTLIMLFIIFPFYWTINTSFKSEGEIVSRVVSYFPRHFTFENYTGAWVDVGFSRFFANSLFVALVSSLLTVVCALFVGYALDRFRFRGKTPFMLVLLCTQFIPSAMLIIPLFLIFTKLGLINTRASLILVYTAFQIPFSSIISISFE